MEGREREEVRESKTNVTKEGEQMEAPGGGRESLQRSRAGIGARVSVDGV